ncbi:uncharacterized protein ColSpa_08420 [Colletotrichum spaethianum]|uniref:Uncharacterized protein n=1 Tax=Colletotrichum spaethianum TaxID=700344 RepID=A0AA37UIM0_9PEZI|nr:uncharacterized protein ColSpa_08420 [Colletotrichum spaethianum]GKT48239.1 hypothetical protein ColSpa_08420 [Colletotrichum spaethianum]
MGNGDEHNHEPDSEGIYASPTILERKRAKSSGIPRSSEKRARPSNDRTTAAVPDVPSLQEPSTEERSQIGDCLMLVRKRPPAMDTA